MIPTLVILAGYLAADILLGGFAAAAAVTALGVAEYVYLRSARGANHPSLIAESLVLAAAVVAGDRLSEAGYGGAEYVLLEVLLGSVLLITSLTGRPWLHRQMMRITGLSAGGAKTGEVSRLMGGLFLVHGAFVGTLIALRTGGVILPALISFVVLYLYVGVRLRMRMSRMTAAEMPSLSESDDGSYLLEFKGETVCEFRLDRSRVAGISDLRIPRSWEIHRCLDLLETSLRSEGFRGLRFLSWERDTIQLQMAGYSETPSGWLKMFLVR